MVGTIGQESLTTNAASSSPTTGTSSTDPLSAGGMQNEFLQLLVTQLQNQDPSNPVDQTQMLSQLAQFSSLTTMQNLSTAMTSANAFAELSQSAGLIGKSVTTILPDGSAGPSGVVASVAANNGKVYLQIGSQFVDATEVSTVTDGSSSGPTL